MEVLFFTKNSISLVFIGGGIIFITKNMKIFGTVLEHYTYKDLFTKLTRLETQQTVFTPNPEILLKTLTDTEFKWFLDKADILTPDWIGLYLAYQIIDSKYNNFINFLLLPYFVANLFVRRRYLYEKYGERICGSDLTNDLLPYAEEKWIKISIIDLYNPTDDAKVASQEVFREKLQWFFPKLAFDYYIYDESKKDEIIAAIKNSDAKMLFSTLGMKKQEESVIEIMSKCYNIKLWLGIGSSFDYFIWLQKRAPKIWRSLWLEWLYRLATGPQKLKRLKRLWNAIFVFMWKVLTYKHY